MPRLSRHPESGASHPFPTLPQPGLPSLEWGQGTAVGRAWPGMLTSIIAGSA